MDSESEEDKSPESKLKPPLQVLDDEESIPECSIQQRATKEDHITSFIQVQENMLFQDAMPSVKMNILVTNINSSLVDL